MKQAEKIYVDLLEQQAIQKEVQFITNAIKDEPFPTRCSLGMNQAKSGGHVASEAKEGEDGRLC